jgi:hypothetical protein
MNDEPRKSKGVDTTGDADEAAQQVGPVIQPADQDIAATGTTGAASAQDTDLAEASNATNV